MVAHALSWEKIKLEMLKCVTRCANCHMIKTKKEIQEKMERGELRKKKKRSLVDPENATHNDEVPFSTAG